MCWCTLLVLSVLLLNPDLLGQGARKLAGRRYFYIFLYIHVIRRGEKASFQPILYTISVESSNSYTYVSLLDLTALPTHKLHHQSSQLGSVRYIEDTFFFGLSQKEIGAVD